VLLFHESMRHDKSTILTPLTLLQLTTSRVEESNLHAPLLRNPETRTVCDGFAPSMVTRVCHLSPTSTFPLAYVVTPPVDHVTHLSHMPHVHPRPRSSALHDFHSQKLIPPIFEPPICEVSRHQILRLSFFLDQWFRSHRDLATRILQSKGLRLPAHDT
jgi:hypothetical protein